MAHKKILLVDDEESICLYMEEILSELEGVEIAVAYDGKQALDVMKTENIAILITDIRMPNIDGIELIQTVQKNTDQVPIIITTGNQATLSQARNLEVTVFFEKPFTAQELKSSVAAILKDLGT